jgi:polyisoprenoid-binding protein YceI
VHARGVDAMTFYADVDTRSLEGGVAPAHLPVGRDAMLAIVKTQLLEVDTYPRATFDGVARRTGDGGACHVTGTLRLHGVARELELDGRVEEIGDALRFTAEISVPRQAFDIRLRGALAAWDAFVPDDVVVSLDVKARREKITVEPVD